MSNLPFFVTGHTTRHKQIHFMCHSYGKNAPLIRSMRQVDNFRVDFFICNSVISFNLYLSNLIN